MSVSDLVVNISSGKPYDVYVGRGKCPRTGKESIWGNPFIIGRDGTRDEVIQKYLEWIIKQPELMARIAELAGKRLGCYCFPASCHASILVELAEEMRGISEEDT